MVKEGKKKKREKKTVTGLKTRLIFETEDEEISETGDKEDFDAGGILLDKESVQIIYNALLEYTPTAKEHHMHEIFLEELEETLVVEYEESYPDAN